MLKQNDQKSCPPSKETDRGRPRQRGKCALLPLMLLPFLLLLLCSLLFLLLRIVPAVCPPCPLALLAKAKNIRSSIVAAIKCA